LSSLSKINEARVSKEGITKSYIIDLYINGAIAIHVVDNLLLVHNTDSKVTMIYDIKEEDLKYLVGAPLPLAPFLPNSDNLEDPMRKATSKQTQLIYSEKNLDFQMYSWDWQFFQPNFIVDGRHGYLWEVIINLDQVAKSFYDKIRLVDFLLRRSFSKFVLLKVLKNLIQENETLSMISTVFDKLNQILASSNFKTTAEQEVVYGKASSSTIRKFFDSDENGKIHPTYDWDNHNETLKKWGSLGDSGLKETFAKIKSVGNSTTLLENTLTKRISFNVGDSINGTSTNDIANPIRNWRNADGYLIVDQTDLYTHVFLPLDDNNVDHKYMVAVVTEYMRSLNFYGISVRHFLYEFVINVLVRNKRFYQLHQLLQYRVVTDSLPVACQLLSLENIYVPAYQLALDMLKRLCSPGQMIEVLLARNQILPALRIVRSHRDIPVRWERFLETAAHGDTILFYHVFKFFEQRKDFIDDPNSKKYTDLFNKTFSNAYNPPNQEYKTMKERWRKTTILSPDQIASNAQQDT